MTSEPGPGSVISLNSESEHESMTSGTKRKHPFDEDEKADTSSSDESTDESVKESPSSKVDAIGPSQRKRAAMRKRQRTEDQGSKASKDSTSAEDGEVREDDSSDEEQSSMTTRPTQPKAGSKTLDPLNFNRGQSDYKLPLWTKTVRTKTWCSEFVQMNTAKLEQISPRVIADAFIYCLKANSLGKQLRATPQKEVRAMKKSGALRNLITSAQKGLETPKEVVAQNTDKAENFISISSESESEGEVTSQPSRKSNKGSQDPAKTARKQTSVAPRDNRDDPLASAVPTGDEALRQQRLYFPSAEDASTLCLLCGRAGHDTTSCPSAACRFCQSYDHGDIACPTLKRCIKCRQMDHAAAECTEKLALTIGDGLVCAYCSGADHTEKDCPNFWRSFDPDQDTIIRVPFIQPTCSTCGAEGVHFAGDCSDRGKWPLNQTWTLANHNRYIDPESSTQSIESEAAASGAGGASSRAGSAPGMKIRGSARTQHVHYSESDSDGGEFLGRSQAKGRPPIGQIRMSSNIQMPNSRANRGPASLPPLPPLPRGQPPPGPRNNHNGNNYGGAGGGRAPPPGAQSYNHPPQGPPPGQYGQRGGPSLPPKPPGRNMNDYRHVPPPASHGQNGDGQSSRGGRARSSRGGGGGRGGNGGGGRGRGRGRGR